MNVEDSSNVTCQKLQIEDLILKENIQRYIHVIFLLFQM